MRLLHLLAALLLVGAGSATTLAPLATAHACTWFDPATGCGECDDLLPHDHRYMDGSVYCQSYWLPRGWHCYEVVRDTYVCVNPGWVESLIGGPPSAPVEPIEPASLQTPEGIVLLS